MVKGPDRETTAGSCAGGVAEVDDGMSEADVQDRCDEG